MAAILNCAILDSAILVISSQTHTCQDWFPPFAHKKTSLIHSDSAWWWQPSGILPLVFNHFQQKNLTHSFWLNLMMAAILNSTILDSAILHKKNFTHSFWLKLMMAAILNSAILESGTLLSSLRFTQKYSHSTLTLTQTDYNLTQSHSFLLYLMMAAILDSANLHKKMSLIHSDSTWWWQPSWTLPSWIQTLPSWIQTPCYLLSVFTQKYSHSTLTLTQTKLQSDIILNSATWFILTLLKLTLMAAIGILDSATFAQKNVTHSFWLHLMMAAILNSTILDSAILHKKNFTHNPFHLIPFAQKTLHFSFTSDLTWWWQPSWILPNQWIWPLTWIQLSWVCPLKLTHTCKDWFPPLWNHIKKLHSFILTQLDDGSHLEFYHLGFSQFAQKKTSVIHSDSNWWWQPSWILPCWIQPLPSWNQTPCYLLSDSLKNTLTPLWLWLILIQTD